MARRAVRAAYQRRNLGRVGRDGRRDASARWYAGGDIAARCPYLGSRSVKTCPGVYTFHFAIAGCLFSLLAVEADSMGIRAAYRKTGIVAAVATVLAGWLLVLPRHTPNP